MPLTDYKWWCVNRDDDGYITFARIHIHEGEYRMLDREMPDGKTEQVNTYVRLKTLGFASLTELSHISDRDSHVIWRERTDKDGKVVKIPALQFTDKDFGKIRTDDELRAFCSGLLKLDTTRTAIDEQKVVE